MTNTLASLLSMSVDDAAPNTDALRASIAAKLGVGVGDISTNPESVQKMAVNLKVVKNTKAPFAVVTYTTQGSGRTGIYLDFTPMLPNTKGAYVRLGSPNDTLESGVKSLFIAATVLEDQARALRALANKAAGK
jgi:hypothetical protein